MANNIGQGSIGLNTRTKPAGPPFPATSANNGLSVDSVTGKIVLGDDIGGTLSQLLSDREIQLNDKSFFMSPIAGTGNPVFGIDQTTGDFIFGDYPGDRTGAHMVIESGLGRIQMPIGGTTSQPDSIVLDIDNSQSLLESRAIVGSDSFTALQLDYLNATYRIGDLSFAHNGMFIEINDPIKNIFIGSANNNLTGILIDDNVSTINFTNGGNNVGLLINGFTGFTGTVTPVTSITVEAGIVTAVT